MDVFYFANLAIPCPPKLRHYLGTRVVLDDLQNKIYVYVKIYVKVKLGPVKLTIKKCNYILSFSKPNCLMCTFYFSDTVYIKFLNCYMTKYANILYAHNTAIPLSERNIKTLNQSANQFLN